MALHRLGKDPESPNGGSPTVYLDTDTGNYLLQGWKVTDADRLAQPAIRDRRGLADDLAAAVQTRLDKQSVLHDGAPGGRFFSVVLEESALRYEIGGRDVMAGQLRHLLAVAAIPTLSLGIIPLEADRSQLWPAEGFFMFDDEQVDVELISAHLTITQPHEIGMYARTFADLVALSPVGAAARGRITAALQALG